VVRKRSAGERQRLLALFEHSGQSQKRFCRENQLPLSTLTYWLRQARQRAPEALEGVLVEVPWSAASSSVTRAGEASRGAVDVRLPNRVELRVAVGTDPAWLSELLRGLLTCSV